MRLSGLAYTPLCPFPFRSNHDDSGYYFLLSAMDSPCSGRSAGVQIHKYLPSGRVKD